MTARAPAAARVRSFAPIADKRAEILILGSMPGEASLKAQQYYAHPQNAFWRIMAELLGFDSAAGYATRVRELKAARIAVWDVLQTCVREGSLDSDIQRDTQVANDFAAFLRAHAKIRRVFFNGAKAQACFAQHVLPRLDARGIRYARLPSTSPAHAALSFQRKLTAWRKILPAERRTQIAARVRRSPVAVTSINSPTGRTA